MTDERDLDDLARELHATREEPRPEFARELDRRAAGWLRERPRRRLPSLRIAIPAVGAAAAAAALVIALAVSGGGNGGAGGPAGQLEVAVVAEGPVPGTAQGGGVAQGAGAPEALETPLQRDSTAAGDGGGAFFLLTREGQRVIVRYLFSAPAEARVELAGRKAEAEIEPGSGSVEISTEGLPRGTHDLTITAPPAPTYRERVVIGG
jgi:hypothetical protein